MLTQRNKEKRIKRQSSLSCLFMLFSLLLPFSFLSIFPLFFKKKKKFPRVRNEEKGLCVWCKKCETRDLKMFVDFVELQPEIYIMWSESERERSVL